MLPLTTAEPKDAFDTHGNVTGNINAWLWPIHVRLFFHTFAYEFQLFLRKDIILPFKYMLTDVR